MAPGLTTELPIQSTEESSTAKKGPSYPAPLQLSGVLDGFEHEDVTPLIGREFPKVNIVDDLLHAENADALLRDVAITSSVTPLFSLSRNLPLDMHALIPTGYQRSDSSMYLVLANQNNKLITVSQRGVVFFRAQDNLTSELQKEFVHKLGLLTGKPATSTLHIHPVLNSTSEFGVGDNEISHISSEARKKMFKHTDQPYVSCTLFPVIHACMHV